MKKQFLFTFALSMLIIISSCKKSDIASGISTCIRTEITLHKNDPQSLVSSVDEYFFQNKLVYGFDYGLAADGQLEVKDESCNVLCRVGGFGGPSVNLCNGENFFQAAVLKRNIWKK
jgi:hypothetical protein